MRLPLTQRTSCIRSVSGTCPADDSGGRRRYDAKSVRTSDRVESSDDDGKKRRAPGPVSVGKEKGATKKSKHL